MNKKVINITPLIINDDDKNKKKIIIFNSFFLYIILFIEFIIIILIIYFFFKLEINYFYNYFFFKDKFSVFDKEKYNNFMNQIKKILEYKCICKSIYNIEKKKEYYYPIFDNNKNLLTLENNPTPIFFNTLEKCEKFIN